MLTIDHAKGGSALGARIQGDLEKIAAAFTKESNSFDLRRRLRAAVTALLRRHVDDGTIADYAFHVAHNGKNETDSGCHEVWVDAVIEPPADSDESGFIYVPARLIFAG